MQSMLEILMERNGYAVTSVFDGADGVKALEDNIYDLVITDMHLPDMDGLDIVKYIKNMENPSAIIAISGGDQMNSHDLHMLNQARKLGVCEVFKKPFETNAFVESIEQILKNRNKSFLGFLKS